MQSSIDTSATHNTLTTGADVSIVSGSNDFGWKTYTGVGSNGYASGTTENVDIFGYSEQQNLQQSINSSGANYAQSDSTNINGVTIFGSSESSSVSANGLTLNDSVTCCNQSCELNLTCCDPAPVTACCCSFFSAAPALPSELVDGSNTICNAISAILDCLGGSSSAP